MSLLLQLTLKVAVVDKEGVSWPGLGYVVRAHVELKATVWARPVDAGCPFPPSGNALPFDTSLAITLATFKHQRSSPLNND